MDMKALERDYCAGILSIQTVADLYGIAKSTLMDWAEKYHWVRIKQPKHSDHKPSKSDHKNGRMDGRTEKSAENRATPADHVHDNSVHSVDPSETKRNRSGNPNPKNQFQANNQAAHKHGGYSVRSQHSAAIVEDARTLTLDDEIEHLRCRNLEAVESIGRCKTQLLDASDDEKVKLYKDIESADNAILRNSTITLALTTG